ncbi:hypothetical protein C7974DRAFT_373755 [Boeremia exigua]|uniref:uncharacterized protein n=1 Tax=Boeremia exigua TaxID=749465 RepID=UPI001E8DE211|nr:uncharacterized protein C7974DRAFT_373755 [Boeremia exigua]KAH6639532.1 hypothetical protein C7974DRAFT_373755 [Boeremia exigua]
MPTAIHSQTLSVDVIAATRTRASRRRPSQEEEHNRRHLFNHSSSLHCPRSLSVEPRLHAHGQAVRHHSAGNTSTSGRQSTHGDPLDAQSSGAYAASTKQRHRDLRSKMVLPGEGLACSARGKELPPCAAAQCPRTNRAPSPDFDRCPACPRQSSLFANLHSHYRCAVPPSNQLCAGLLDHKLAKRQSINRPKDTYVVLLRGTLQGFLPNNPRPPFLWRLIAARKPSKSSLDMSAEPTSSVYSCADSGFYSASECSTPPTPSLYARGHFRFPSSASSLSSSPPTHEINEAPNASGKLPKLTEEPIEQEYHYGPKDTHHCSCDTENGHESSCEIARAYEFQDEYFRSVDAEIRMAKRRRSLESSANSITNKIERRFPSFSRKVKERKRASSSFTRVSRSETPSRVPSTRSSSITSSIRHVQSFDISQQYSQVSTPAHSMEHLSENSAPMEIDVVKANAIDIDIDPEQIDAERYATTPLLPPLLMCRDVMPTSSPLQSPTIANTAYSSAPTPLATPPARAYATPTLSAKPSMTSIRISRPGYSVSSADIPPMMLADPDDKWTNLLGHANFTIQPEPYVPERCDATSLRQLFTDWESARCNYAKHQVRTAEHYGVTSKHYTLTEQKWAEIDAEWKRNHEVATTYAAAHGQLSPVEPLSPAEPAPLCKMPTLNDPKSEGKFPKLGDEDVVGPMVQIASPLMLKTPSRKRAFFKFLNDLLPGSLLGRSSAGVRGH